MACDMGMEINNKHMGRKGLALVKKGDEEEG